MLRQRKRWQNLSEDQKRADREKHTKYMREYRLRPGSRELACRNEKKSRELAQNRVQAEPDVQPSFRALSGLDRL